jgi:hypothetical protein
MYKKSITITAAVLAASILAVVAISTPFAFASTESETETEQEIKQKNVCSGWAICTNEAVNTEDTGLATTTTTTTTTTGSVFTFP